MEKKKKINWEKELNYGHYAVAIGFTKDKIIFQDPSSFKRTYLLYEELSKRWHDVDTSGKRYFNHGIAIFGKKSKFNRDEIVHMD